MIQLDRITKRFETQTGGFALDNIDLAIPAGQMVSIVGASGSGCPTPSVPAEIAIRSTAWPSPSRNVNLAYEFKVSR